MDGSENSGVKYINYQVVLAEVSHRYTKAVLLEMLRIPMAELMT